jgi:hypothetical protein
MIRAIRGNPRDPTVYTYHVMTEELFESVRMLYEQVTAQYGEDRPSEGMVGTQMAVSDNIMCCVAPFLTDHTLDILCVRMWATGCLPVQVSPT